MENAGQRLKQVRLGKGFTLEDIQKKTKIHLNILKAIEGEAITDLSPIYLKSFLKIYCQFLKVDSKDYIQDYKGPKPEPVSIKPKAVKQDSFLKSSTPRLASLIPSLKWKKILSLGLGAVIILVALFNLGKFISSRRQAKLTQGPKSALTFPVRKTKTQVKPAVAAVANVKQFKDSVSGINLGIQAKERCFITLRTDGRLVFQSRLEKGRYISWKAKEKMELSLSDAAAVELVVNGQRFTNLGRKGQALKNIIINKQGLNIGR